MEHSHDQAGQPARKHRHEGPRNHILSFILSIALTILAFLAAANTNFTKPFIYAFILILAVVQVIIQLYFWMHLKDRGHTMPQLFIWLGAFVMGTIIVTAVYWVWW